MFVDEFVAKSLPARRGRPLPYDGVYGRINKPTAERGSRLNLPIVNVWVNSPSWQSLPAVFPDLRASGQLIAEHLLARGLRRFAAMASEERGARLEVRSLCETVEQAGVHCITERLPLSPLGTYAEQKRSERWIHAWIDQWTPPIGVYVYGDMVGRVVAQVCNRRGLRIPQDVALVAGANEEAMCVHPQPSLTSIERGYERIGYAAAKLLDELMEAREQGRASRTSPRHILLPPTGLVVRESTDFFAVDDPVVRQALEFIAANAQRPIGQDDVARAVLLETSTVQLRFRKVLGKPIVATIRQVRLDRAKRELAHGENSLKRIARDVGFGNAQRMYEVFQRELGMSPSAYRKERRME